MITRQLLAQDKSVRILVRHPSPSEELAKLGMATTAQTLIDAGAQPVYGDLKDPPSLVEACAGVATVITTANSILRGGEDNIATVDLNGTKSLIDAAKAAGAGHFIYVSLLGATPENPQPFVSAKGQCEAYLKQSGLTYTILKPGMFMETWIGDVVGAPLRAGQPVTLVGQGARQQVFASIADVAAYAVAAVDHPLARNREIEIGAPSAYSWTEVVAAVSKAVGRDLPIHYVAPGSPIPLVVAPEFMGQLLAGMEMSDNSIDMGEPAKTFGISATPLDGFVERFFASNKT
jgi:NADH dehydrogenase